MATLRQRLEKLKDQREVLDARKRRNRQKYIVGGIVLAALHENNALATQLLALIKNKASDDDLDVLAEVLPQQKATVQQPLVKSAFDV